MFAGFNLQINEQDIMAPYFEKEGAIIYYKQKNQIKKDLEDYMVNGNEISVPMLEKDWFPSLNVDVFISHSHKDESLAIAFAGFLNKIFGLNCFIDSCVWGCADDLLKSIDRKFCVSKRNDDGTIKTYDYEMRNKSTANVHIILNSALQKMIDKTECLMFLNTPNALLMDDLKNDINAATSSPWIYSELLFSRLAEKKKLSEYRTTILLEYAQHSDSLDFRYDVSLDHLIDLDRTDILHMWTRCKNVNSTNPDDRYKVLDYLYKYKGILSND